MMVHFQLINSKFLADITINYESKYVKYDNWLFPSLLTAQYYDCTNH